jgi:hypothetical protein
VCHGVQEGGGWGAVGRGATGCVSVRLVQGMIHVL